MTITCPAKINLTLEVLDRRSDGYHTLRSVMIPLELADELTVEPASDFRFACTDPRLDGDKNLVVRAFNALETNARAALRLSKRVPYEAGLGSGSSDAAGVLRAAMAGAFGALADIDWLAVARRLGSDVPFFLANSGALVEGTGERVTVLGALPAWHVLIVKPPVAVSTARAYTELDRHARPSRRRSASVSLRMVTAVQRHDFDEVERLLMNDFEPVIAAQTPEVSQALQALHAAGAKRPLLAGSGSAVFALAPDESTLAQIERRVDLPAAFGRYPTRFATASTWRG